MSAAGTASGALAAAEDAFAASTGLFEHVKADLAGPGTAAMTHSQLEDMLGLAMREVTRSLFQDHLRLRALTEVRVADVVDAHGVERTRIERGRTRILGTVFGKVTATRIAYRGTRGRHPEAHTSPRSRTCCRRRRGHRTGRARLFAARELFGGGHVPGDVRLAAVVDSDRVPQHVVVGVVEDVLDLQAHPVGRDTEVLRLLVVHLSGPAAGDNPRRADRCARRRLDSAQMCPRRLVLCLAVFRHG